MSEPKRAGDAPDVRELTPGAYAWCACGQSGGQPFCDGSHAGSGMAPVPFTMEEAKTVALCLCKQTGNPPFCDGSHAR